MRKIVRIVVLVLLSSCATKAVEMPTEEKTSTPAPTATSLPRERPGDFQVRYYWETGSLPPPYFYSYTITIGPGTDGSLEFVPDYTTYDPPLWLEGFQVSERDLDLLYAALYQAEAFEAGWEQSEDIPTGGSADKMTIIAHGREYLIPSYVDDDEKSKAIKRVYEDIEAFVPQAIWDKLNAQHDQYVLEHEDEE